MTKEELEELIQSEKNLLIKLKTDWCVASNNFEVELMKIYPSHKENIKLVNIDVDNFPYTREFFSTNIIPSLIFIKDGEIKTHISGRSTYQIIGGMINKIFYDK